VDSGVDPGLANQYGWQLGNHSPDWETLTCDNWRGPYLREWPHNPWGGLYGWSNFPGQYGPWGIPGAGAYLTLQSSDWGGANGMPDAVFEKMAEEMGLDRSPMKGVIAVWMGKDQPAGGTQPAAR
jgi:hypothetical protein